jgi:phosphotransferase system  glucose/maltose/N-acetylglucosamine-specific IIC component
MKVSATITIWICGVFALGCFAFAMTGFLALDALPTDAERELSRGYAWFWMFLALVAVIFGALSWMIKKGKLGQME